MTSGNLEYAVFKAGPGFFGLLCRNNTIIRTSLPIGSGDEVRSRLLEGFAGEIENKNLLKPLHKEICAYFEGNLVEFEPDLPLDLSGLTVFSQDILNACRTISYGETVSYSQIATIAGHPKAARAVGNALGNNPLPLLIPCHRIICSNGKIGGFMRGVDGGISLKQQMLKIERNCRAAIDRAQHPKPSSR